jgi:lactoylglutathione lyase
MIRVLDLEANLKFFELMGLKEISRKEVPAGKFTLIFLATAEGEPELELTYNWDQKEAYSGGRNFGHLAYEVENIYETCQKLMDNGVKILRPPRDGHMAFVRSPDQISTELLQIGSPLPAEEPWVSMENQGEW